MLVLAAHLRDEIAEMFEEYSGREAELFDALESRRIRMTVKAREAAARWYAANKDKAREATARWRAANKDKTREAAARWYAANKDKAREAAARWYAANKDKKREAAARWYAANKDKKREAGISVREWRCRRCGQPGHNVRRCKEATT